jgi:hypothetical protein
MICPSCSFTSPTQTDYCIRCGFFIAKNGQLLVSFRNTFTWVLRRSLAGFAAGAVGWLVTPAASRAAGASLSQAGHFLLSGALGGFFLGAAEGMLEDSTLKTIRGGFAGVIGGLLGSLVAVWIARGDSGNTWAGNQAVMATWALSGAAIGLVSALMERKRSRIAAGFFAGLVGGALGGWLGYQMYASLMDISKPEWGLKRLIEGSTGAILGAVFWAVLGLVEKLFIFKRRVVQHVSYKECEICRHNNVFKAWYCAGCGAVLQVSAPPDKLEAPRRPSLARFIAANQFLGRLTATTCTVVGLLAAIFLGSINFFLGLFGLLATTLVGYIGYVLFNTLADSLSPLL